MKFNYSYENESGVVVSYHKIVRFEVYPETGKCTARVLSYVSQAAHDANKPNFSEVVLAFTLDPADNDLDKVVKKVAPIIEAAFIASKAGA
jgi:hypothetical protein